MLKNNTKDPICNQKILNEASPIMPEAESFWMPKPSVILNNQLTSWNENIRCIAPLKDGVEFKLVLVNASVLELELSKKISKVDLKDESLVVAASIWSREGHSPQNDTQNQCMNLHIKKLLSRRGHPCLVEYYGHALVGNQHRFIGPAYNASSLQDWMTKFKGALEPDWKMAFAKSIFIQLMFALYELHRTDAYYGEPIIPSQVRMTSDGNVVLPNALGEHIVAGTFISIGRRNPQKPDISSVIKLVFDIIGLQPSLIESDIKPQEVAQINLFGDDAFKNVLCEILEHPEYAALDILNLLSDKKLIDPCQKSGLMWREAHQFWIDSKGHSEIDGMDYHQIYLSLINDATRSSRLFIKNNLSNLLSKEEPLNEDNFNWFALRKLGSNISEVRPSFRMMTQLNLTKNQSFCRIESRNPVSYEPWMIEFSKWHPNISSIVNYGNTTLIVDYSNKRTLKQVIKRIENTAMKDFLFSVTLQVLHTLIMIEFGLDCSPPPVSADTILLNASGAVTLAGFFKKSTGSIPIKESMANLSKTLLDIASQQPGMNDFIQYAHSLKEKSDIIELHDDLLRRNLYAPIIDRQYISELRKNGVTGEKLPQLFSSWKNALLNSNLAIEIKSNISLNMQNLCKSMMSFSMRQVHQALVSSLRTSPLDQSTRLPVLIQSSNSIEVDVPFVWIKETLVLRLKEKVFLWAEEAQCMIPSDRDDAKKLVFFGQEEDNNSKRILFSNGSFQSVYIKVAPLQLGLYTGIIENDYEKQVEVSIWKRSFDNLIDKPDDIRHRNSLFKKREHPCLVEYYGYAYFNGEHRFIGQSFNGLSLKSWMTKLAGSLSPNLQTRFGKAVFTHLLFALYELHREGRFYGEALVPEDIRMSNEGDIVIPDALGERLIAGIQVTQNDSTQRQDILSLIQLTYSIITNNQGDSIDAVTVGKIKKRVSGDDLFKFGLIQILENPDLSVFDIIQLFKAYNLIETSMKPHQQHDKYLSAVSEALVSSRDFLKNIIVPMLSNRKVVVSSEEEWTIMAVLSSSVDMVELSDEFIKRIKFNLDNSLACVKRLIVKDTVRRLFTILGCAYHPHIIRMFAGTRLNQNIHLITECAEEGSLAKLIQYVPSESRPEFLYAVTVQVLQALVYLHDVLGFAHRDITAENIVFDKNGCVKLIGFAANAPQSGSVTSDMEMLSNTLLKLLPEINEVSGFREFASKDLPCMPAIKALDRPELNNFITPINKEWAETINLKKEGWLGVASLENLMAFYKEKSKDTQDPKRFMYRSDVKGLILKIEQKATNCIQLHLRTIKNSLENQKPLNPQPLGLLKKGYVIEKAVPFVWMNGTIYKNNSQSNTPIECVILNNNDQDPKLKRKLFTTSEFEQVYFSQRNEDELRDHRSCSSIWAREGLPFNTNREEYVTALLAKRKHPHILEYSAYTAIENEHRFMGQESSSKWWSLEAWMDKLILTPSVANKFGEAVFIQLLFALYELHEENSFYGECLFPSDIRISDEGIVVIPNARGERLVAGTESSIIKNPQQKDIQSVVKIMQSIILWKKFETFKTLTSRQFLSHNSFENNVFFKRILEECVFNNSEISARSILNTMSYFDYLKSFSVCNEGAIEINQKRQEHLSNILGLTTSSRNFIKNELVPMLSIPGCVTVTSDEDQNIKKVLGKGRYLVDPSSGSQHRVIVSAKDGESWCYLKKVDTRIMSRESRLAFHDFNSTRTQHRHPNIIEVFAISHSKGYETNILMEYALHKSLREIMQYVSKENIVDLLFAMAVQVLNALLYIDINCSELQANLSMDKILFCGNGLVKLAGLRAKHNHCDHDLSAMTKLSEIILELIPENTAIDFGLREFAIRIKTMTPLDALDDNVLKKFFDKNYIKKVLPINTQYDEQQKKVHLCLKELTKFYIGGDTLSKLITSWKNWDSKEKNIRYKDIVYKMITTVIIAFEQKSISIMRALCNEVLENIELFVGRDAKQFTVLTKKGEPPAIKPEINSSIKRTFFKPVSPTDIGVLCTALANVPVG